MIIRSMGLLILIAVISSCAASKIETAKGKTVELNSFPCNECNQTINNSSLFSYPLRYVIDEWYVTTEDVNEQTNSIEARQGYFERLYPFSPKNMNVYTEDEFKEMKALVFCFIGKRKSEIKELLTAKEIFTVGDNLYFRFNVGKYKGEENGKQTYSILQEKILAFNGFDGNSQDAIFIGIKEQQEKLKECK